VKTNLSLCRPFSLLSSLPLYSSPYRPADRPPSRSDAQAIKNIKRNRDAVPGNVHAAAGINALQNLVRACVIIDPMHTGFYRALSQVHDNWMYPYMKLASPSNPIRLHLGEGRAAGGLMNTPRGSRSCFFAAHPSATSEPYGSNHERTGKGRWSRTSV